MLELKYDEATKKFSFTSRFNYGSLLKSQPFVAMVAKNDLTRIVSSFGSRGDDDDEEGIMSRFAFFLFDVFSTAAPTANGHELRDAWWEAHLGFLNQSKAARQGPARSIM